MAKKPRMSDFDFAKALLLEFAGSGDNFIVPNAFYDEDAEWQDRLAERLGVQDLKWLRNKTFRVCNRLCDYGVLVGEMQINPDRQYLGEPGRWRRFTFSDPSYRFRLAPEKWPHYTPMGKPEHECEYLIRHLRHSATDSGAKT